MTVRNLGIVILGQVNIFSQPVACFRCFKERKKKAHKENSLLKFSVSG